MLKEKFSEEHNVSDYEQERHKPMPSLNHSLIQTNLIVELAAYRDRFRTASELSLELSNWPSVPDVSLIPAMKMDTRNDQIKVSEPPLCVMEILSPTQSFADLLAKAHSYFEHGVQSCWIVMPGVDNIYVFSNPDEYEIFRSGEMLIDKKMNIQLEVGKVFE
ncbi:MAG: Uma2 family endonuclease [Saprospiraceae bacterium]